MADYKAMAAQYARQAASKYGLDPNQFSRIFLRQINQESGFNPSAKSGAGAVGIAQIVPHWHPDVNAADPVASLKWASERMASTVKRYGGYAPALSAYNSGKPNAYKDPHFAHGETYNYVRRILGASDVQTGPNGARPSANHSVAVGGLTGAPGRTYDIGNLREQLIQSILKPGKGKNIGGLLDLAISRMQLDAANERYGAGVPTGSLIHAPRPGAGGAPHPNGSTFHQLEPYANQFGLSVTSTTGGKHAPHSYHYQGRAVDYGGNSAHMASLYSFALAHPRQFTEAFYTGPGAKPFYVKNGQVLPISQLDSGLRAEHTTHVHLAR